MRILSINEGEWGDKAGGRRDGVSVQRCPIALESKFNIIFMLYAKVAVITFF